VVGFGAWSRIVRHLSVLHPAQRLKLIVLHRERKSGRLLSGLVSLMVGFGGFGFRVPSSGHGVWAIATGYGVWGMGYGSFGKPHGVPLMHCQLKWVSRQLPVDLNSASFSLNHCVFAQSKPTLCSIDFITPGREKRYSAECSVSSEVNTGTPRSGSSLTRRGGTQGVMADMTF
jgi:hypothetical protein